MNIENRIEQSHAKQERVVFMNSVNEHETLFGGLALKWMDEVAYLSASKFAKKDLFTSSVGPVKFLKTVPYGSFISIEAKVLSAGSVKLSIKVNIYIADKQSDTKIKAVEGVFVFVAVDKNFKPVRLA